MDVIPAGNHGSVRSTARGARAARPAEARHLAEAAAILDVAIEPALLAEVSGDTADEVAAGLAELVRHHVLEPDGDGLYHFTHGKLRETAYGLTPPTQRARLHRRAAEALEPRSGEASLPLAAALASHWEGAGEIDRARTRYREAGRLASSAWAFEEAVRLTRCYLRLCDQPTAETIASRHQLALWLHVMGRSEEARREHRRELREARTIRSSNQAAASLAALANIDRLQGRRDRPQRLYGLALRIHRFTGDGVGQARCLGGLADLAAEQGRRQEALALYEEVLARAREASDPRLQAAAITNLASLHYEEGRLARSRELCREALPFFEAAQDLRGLLGTWNNLASILQEEGDLEAAERAYEQALGARAAGDVRFQCHLLANLAGLRQIQGDLPRALSLVDEALSLIRRLREPRLAASLHGERGKLLRQLGKVDDARRSFEIAANQAQEASDPRIEAAVCLDLASLGESDGGLESERLLQRAKSLAESLGDRSLQGLVLLAMARRMRLSGSLADAHQHLREASERLAASERFTERIALLCEEGRLKLAQGENARDYLEEAEVLLSRMRNPAHGDAVSDCRELRRAVEARERDVGA